MERSPMISFPPSRAGGNPTLEVVIRDDHPIVRAGLRLFLTGQPDRERAEEAGTDREARLATRRIRALESRLPCPIPPS
jgi:hypothetical protein